MQRPALFAAFPQRSAHLPPHKKSGFFPDFLRFF
jgi:hypothetical protein